tara:strand:- start:3472 stop:3927 length:456 start_codon:yes stop_codon:yes gene_type:complete
MTSRKTPQQLSAERRIAREKWQAEEFPKLSEEKQKEHTTPEHSSCAEQGGKVILVPELDPYVAKAYADKWDLKTEWSGPTKDGTGRDWWTVRDPSYAKIGYVIGQKSTDIKKVNNPWSGSVDLMQLHATKNKDGEDYPLSKYFREKHKKKD